MPQFEQIRLIDESIFYRVSEKFDLLLGLDYKSGDPQNPYDASSGHL